jgi:protein-tyrosine phosphatase
MALSCTAVSRDRTSGRRFTRWRAGAVTRVRTLGRRIVEAVERSKAQWLRRHPARLARALRQARSILVVCQGNVIRSVFAEHLLAAGLGRRASISVRSAGLETVAGWPVHPYVRARAAELEIDIGHHASTVASKALMDAADVVLVMEVSQLVVVRRRFPEARPKTFLLSALDREMCLDIRDPNGKDAAAFATCLDQIAHAVKPIVASILSEYPSSTRS